MGTLLSTRSSLSPRPVPASPEIVDAVLQLARSFAASCSGVLWVFDSPVPVRAKDDGVGGARARVRARGGLLRFTPDVLLEVVRGLRGRGHDVILSAAQGDHQLAGLFRSGVISVAFA